MDKNDQETATVHMVLTFAGVIRPQRNRCCLLLNVPSICLPAVYDISDKEFLHLMYITVRIQSEDLASYELMK
jgi:hypothetical protein